MQRQGVDLRHQLCADGGVYGAVAGQAGQVRKGGRRDFDDEMAFAALLIPAMAAVAFAVIGDGQGNRIKGRAQAGFNLIFACHVCCHLGAHGQFTPSAWRVFVYTPLLESERQDKMAKPDPFGFDLSVSSDKKKRSRGKRGMSGAFETSTRQCEHEGCTEAGKYRAPKSPDILDDYFWFCKDHVREYNLKWNFFNGSEEDVLAQQEKDRVWERETKPFRRSDEQRAWARLGVDDPHQVLGENATQNPGKSTTGSTRRLPPAERKAIEILEARDHWTKAELRKQYKALIKVLHPDMNGGDRSDEERLQEVVWAWDQIKDSHSFK
jgi:hypothetical protein